MLKRKLYWITMGLALSQLSIAKFSSTSDCVVCGPSKEIEFPKPILSKDQDFLTSINNSLIANRTGFVHGDGMLGVLPAVVEPEAPKNLLAPRSIFSATFTPPSQFAWSQIPVRLFSNVGIYQNSEGGQVTRLPGWDLGRYYQDRYSLFNQTSQINSGQGAPLYQSANPPVFQMNPQLNNAVRNSYSLGPF